MSSQIQSNSFPFHLDADMILRGQGADPQVIRKRRPELAELAQTVIREGSDLLSPAIFTAIHDVREFRHGQVVLDDGAVFNGSIINSQLFSAEKICLAVVTIGNAVEDFVSECMKRDPVLALAYDGLGNAAVEQLAASVCSQWEGEFRQSGLQTTMVLSPGMDGWPVDEGQPQIFSVLKPDPAIVRLTESCQMSPRKSNSFIIGAGLNVKNAGNPCDFCSMQKTCKFR